MRPAEVVRRAADYLTRHDVESPLPTAEVLLAQVLGIDRAGLYARDEGLSTAQAKCFGRAICRRCVGEPLQHVTGEQGFRRSMLVVRPGVFVPRPETEILVELVLAELARLESPVVVDVGTGSGAIALAVKDERADARVLATDLSPAAVALARENALNLGLQIEVFQGDLLDPVPATLRGAVHAIVSNPPYVGVGEMETLPREVRAEPSLALVGGMDLYERLFEQARSTLRPSGLVAVEIEETKGRVVGSAASAAGFVNVRIERDLTGRDRFVLAQASR